MHSVVIMNHRDQQEDMTGKKSHYSSLSQQNLPVYWERGSEVRDTRGISKEGRKTAEKRREREREREGRKLLRRR